MFVSFPGHRPENVKLDFLTNIDTTINQQTKKMKKEQLKIDQLQHFPLRVTVNQLRGINPVTYKQSLSQNATEIY